ncbi:MAG: hypothetical protein QHJ73_00985 [Armatimonadota bacterium]|nr:hypothetical protein [Armatimonadota bacterium]
MNARQEWPVPSWIRRGTLRWVWGLWEPLMFYRRSAHLAAYSPGNAPWTREWYERMHSREIVEKLADLGVNCLTTHYFKGFGLRAEAAEMECAAEFTALCHEHGIRVLGYVQWSTLCYETFLDEVPHARDWVQRDPEGKPLLYGSTTYWRWLGCQRHEEYFAYLREVVRRCLTHAGMDGIEWDGTVSRCHCERCQDAFRRYLEAKHAQTDLLETFGLPHFRHVRISTTENRRDPLFQETIAFRRDFFRQRLREYNALIKRINPEAAQVTYAADSLAPDRPDDATDILVDENHDAPFVHQGVLTTKMRGLKHGNANGRMVLSTSWLRAPSPRGPNAQRGLEDAAEIAAFGAAAGGLRRPETAAEVTRDLAEDAVYGGHLITPTWALRSTGGERAAFEDPILYPALRRYLHFFRQYQTLYDVAQSLATVAVVRAHAALNLDYFNVYPCVVGMEQVCLQHQIPFDLVFSYTLEQAERYQALLLPEQTCLSDDEVAALLAFVAKGGGLVLTGQTGQFDERFRPRREDPFAAVRSHPRVVSFPDNPERLSRPQRDRVTAYHDMRLPQRSPEVAAAILQVAQGKVPYRVEATRFVGTDGYITRGGARVIHLLNYDNDHPVESVRVRLGPELAVRAARLLSPDADPVERVVRRTPGEECCFVVERLETYAALVLSGGAGSEPPQEEDGAERRIESMIVS